MELPSRESPLCDSEILAHHRCYAHILARLVFLFVAGSALKLTIFLLAITTGMDSTTCKVVNHVGLGKWDIPCVYDGKSETHNGFQDSSPSDFRYQKVWL
jgi:hypothetical protein